MNARSISAILALILFFPLALASQTGKSAGKVSLVSSGSASVAQPGNCIAFDSAAEGGEPAPDKPAADKTPTIGHGFDPANLDRSVMPCDDFYKFAMGGWLKNNPIPADRAAWSTFNILQDHNEDALRAILEDSAKDKSAQVNTNWQKIGDFYSSCTNEAQIETAGLMPLDPEFQRIAEIKDAQSLQAEIAHLHRIGVNAVFSFGSEQDLKDSTEVIAAAGQGGLGLPDRQYYVDDDDRSKQVRAGYIQHVTNMFKLMGDDDATAAADAKVVFDVELLLAKASTKREDLRDPERNYHRLALPQLAELTPHLSWTGYFDAVGVPAVHSADIGQLDFFKAMDAAFVSVPLAQWKTYLRWHLVHSVAPALSAKFVDENFNFYSRTLTGTKEMLPRWRRCVESTDRRLGEALGQYYVKRNFPPEAKAKAEKLVQNLIAALRADLSTLDWMSPATRVEAVKKLNAINLKIGYPSKWRDYSNYSVDRGPYVENVLRGYGFAFARDLAKIGKPVDRTEWDMSPPTVNAYYNPSMNEIVFPAGILQPPFFDPHADDAINYGGIGAVIGHEMTHGFDDQGAKFDGNGNLKDWWTPEDLKNFEARGDCIAKQFEAFEVEPGLHENGKLVEGESIADLGGVTIAYNAFLKTPEGKHPSRSIDGFTAEQRFFLGWAQIWASNYRPEYARLIAKTNEHPIDQFRADGAMANTPAFAKAWSCGANSSMVRGEGLRCRIW